MKNAAISTVPTTARIMRSLLPMFLVMSRSSDWRPAGPSRWRHDSQGRGAGRVTKSRLVAEPGQPAQRRDIGQRDLPALPDDPAAAGETVELARHDLAGRADAARQRGLRHLRAAVLGQRDQRLGEPCLDAVESNLFKDVHGALHALREG